MPSVYTVQPFKRFNAIRPQAEWPQGRIATPAERLEAALKAESAAQALRAHGGPDSAASYLEWRAADLRDL